METFCDGSLNEVVVMMMTMTIVMLWDYLKNKTLRGNSIALLGALCFSINIQKKNYKFEEWSFDCQLSWLSCHCCAGVLNE